MGVKLIAGPSNVGKSTVAASLVDGGGGRILHVDDLARRSSDRALAFERDPSVWSEPPDKLVQKLIGKGEALWPLIERWIYDAAQDGTPTIIEGEGPSPEHVVVLSREQDVQPVFIIEPSSERLFGTLHQRSRVFRELPPSHRSNVVEMNVLYGEWLRGECDRLDLPWLISQPWSTLRDRCAAALEINVDGAGQGTHY